MAQYTKVVREHPDNLEAVRGLERSKLRASEAHLTRGRRMFAQGKYDDAVLELQIASYLNPTSAVAERDLRAARAAVRAKLAAPPEGTAQREARQPDRYGNAGDQPPGLSDDRADGEPERRVRSVVP